MNRLKRIVVSSLLGTVVYFALGWLVFEFLLGNYMENNTTQVPGFKKTSEEFSLFMMILSCASYSVLLSVILGWWGNISKFEHGFVTGSITGILIAIMADSYWYSTSHFFNSIYPLLVDVVAAGVTVGLTGGVIAMILGHRK